MRIGRRFMACVSLVFIFTSGNPLFAQQADTFNTKIFKPFWTQQRFVPKIGAGVQDRGFFEIGIQWHNIYWHPLSLASKGPYATVDIFMDNEDVVLYGPKLGYEFTAGVLGVAFDVTYFIDRNDQDENNNTKAFVGTPKAGLTILGFVDLYYGYQIPFSKEKIDWINPNRFSITFNLNRDYFDLKDARRRNR
ncbi:MAG TPA: hypothetical protein VD884_19585 [Ohtaekwangia sp.]|nr:hypothetical protein [Ohtaekwangia sp.]